MRYKEIPMSSGVEGIETSHGNPSTILPSLLVLVLFVISTSPAALAVNDLDPTMSQVGDGPQAPVPTISVQLIPDELEAEVSQSQLGAVTFGGTVDVDQSVLMNSKVTLQAVVNSGWPVVISPQSFDVLGTDSLSFQVTVIVPPATSSLLTGLLRVVGTLKPPGMSPLTSDDTALVTVAQYHSVNVTSMDTKVKVKRGDGRTLKGSIINTGNGMSTFWLSIEPVDKIGVSVSDQRVDIDADDRVEFSVRVSVARSAPAGIHSVIIHVDARSDSDHSHATASLPFLIEVPTTIQSLGTGGLSLIIIGIVVLLTLVTTKVKGIYPFGGRRVKDTSSPGEALEEVDDTHVNGPDGDIPSVDDRTG
jgi:hypothetical protein